MRWTTEEDARVLEMYPTHTRAQMAAALGRTIGQVRSRCWTLGLASKIVPWTEAETERLRMAYAGAMISDEIDLAGLAEQLGRDKANVCRKARALGLTDPRRRKVRERKTYPPKFPSAEARAEESSRRMKEWHQNHEHPKGALGMKHTKEAKAKVAAASREAWADPASGLNTEEEHQRRSDLMLKRNIHSIMSGANSYSRTKKGRREDVGPMFFRSSWEANYARFLNLRVRVKEIVSWEYEKHTFWFEHIKRGVRSYTPDFKVIFADGRHEWHEVKGWMDPKSKTKLARMGRCYPREKIIIVDEKWFRSAKKSGLAATIACWE